MLALVFLRGVGIVGHSKDDADRSKDAESKIIGTEMTPTSRSSEVHEGEESRTPDKVPEEPEVNE